MHHDRTAERTVRQFTHADWSRYRLRAQATSYLFMVEDPDLKSTNVKSRSRSPVVALSFCALLVPLVSPQTVSPRSRSTSEVLRQPIAAENLTLKPRESE